MNHLKASMSGLAGIGDPDGDRSADAAQDPEGHQDVDIVTSTKGKAPEVDLHKPKTVVPYPGGSKVNDETGHEEHVDQYEVADEKKRRAVRR
jgi:hypothetical protein